MVNDNGLGSENCEYTFNFVYGKNCYLVTTSWYAENCFYVSKSGRLRDVLDCDNVSESELLHDCIPNSKYAKNADIPVLLHIRIARL